MIDVIMPFKLEITAAQIADLRARLAQTRWPESEAVDDWSQGVPLRYMQALCNYWANDYDMQRLAQQLNAYPQYRTQIDGLDIHFLHIRSPQTQARPLLITHGWPGSVVEFLKVIGPLTDPVAHGGRAEDAFHLVCPSLPGFGFSGKPAHIGWESKKPGLPLVSSWSDLGMSVILRKAVTGAPSSLPAVGASEAAHCAGIHLNMVVCAPSPKDPPDAADLRAFAKLQHYQDWDSGYSKQQSTRPQTIGYGLCDSPSGQAAWIVEKFWSWMDCGGHPESVLSRDELLDNIMVYWLSNSAASSARLYWQSFRVAEYPRSVVPLGGSVFPHDIFLTPRHWAEAHYANVVYWNELDKGGHFAAMEQPELFVNELRACFAHMSLGG